MQHDRNRLSDWPFSIKLSSRHARRKLVLSWTLPGAEILLQSSTVHNLAMPGGSRWSLRLTALLFFALALLALYKAMFRLFAAVGTFALLSLPTSVDAAVSSTPQALNPQLTNTIPDAPGGPVLYYNGSGPVPPYNMTSPIPTAVTPLNRYVQCAARWLTRRLTEAQALR
jgi:hypothetical protein